MHACTSVSSWHRWTPTFSSPQHHRNDEIYCYVANRPEASIHFAPRRRTHLPAALRTGPATMYLVTETDFTVRWGMYMIARMPPAHARVSDSRIEIVQQRYIYIYIYELYNVRMWAAMLAGLSRNTAITSCALYTICQYALFMATLHVATSSRIFQGSPR